MAVGPGRPHQPVEQLASLRNIPGLDVVRPGDANETSIYWRTIIEHTNRPAGIVLSRQNVPVLDRGDDTGHAPADAAVRCGYILAEADGGTPSVLLIGTGSEVQVALDARELLQSHGIPARFVSMPCVEWFAAQDPAYPDTVLPPGIRARVSVEAGGSSGWKRSSVPPLTARPCTASSASLPLRSPPHERASTTPRTAPGQETAPPPLPRPPAAPPTALPDSR